MQWIEETYGTPCHYACRFKSKQMLVKMHYRSQSRVSTSMLMKFSEVSIVTA